MPLFAALKMDYRQRVILGCVRVIANGEFPNRVSVLRTSSQVQHSLDLITGATYQV